MSGRLRIVTGFVPIRNTNRSVETYRQLAELGLLTVRAARSAYECAPSALWLRRLVDKRPSLPAHAEYDNPGKNTLNYHAVQHQKTAWIAQAAEENPDVETFVWIDYGVFHMPGITRDAIEHFLDLVARSRPEVITLPGCWPRAPVTHGAPCWRFCGSVLVCPRPLASSLDTEVRTQVVKELDLINHVDFEVNTWARVELSGALPFRWYAADHDVTMFDNYPGKSE